MKVESEIATLLLQIPKVSVSNCKSNPTILTVRGVAQLLHATARTIPHNKLWPLLFTCSSPYYSPVIPIQYTIQRKLFRAPLNKT